MSMGYCRILHSSIPRQMMSCHEMSWHHLEVGGWDWKCRVAQASNQDATSLSVTCTQVETSSVLTSCVCASLGRRHFFLCGVTWHLEMKKIYIHCKGRPYRVKQRQRGAMVLALVPLSLWCVMTALISITATAASGSVGILSC